MQKYKITMRPKDSDSLDDIRVYKFNDVNEIYQQLIDKNNPINQALHREALRELSNMQGFVKDLVAGNFEDWIEHEFTNVTSDIDFYIRNCLIGGRASYTFWNIVHELEVIK